MEIWAKHYKELYSNENMISNGAFVINNTLLIMKELDAPPSNIEQERAIQSLASVKPLTNATSPRGVQSRQATTPPTIASTPVQGGWNCSL